MMTALATERRGSLRAQVNRPGSIRIGAGPEMGTQVIDISQSGASLFYSGPLAIGTEVELRFQLNIDGPVKCLAYGQVRHHSLKGGSHVIGVLFTHFVPETVEAIHQYLAKKNATASGG